MITAAYINFPLPLKTACTRLLCAAAAAIALLTPLSADQRERVLQFHSRVSVAPDSSLAVTEHIRVFSAGSQIRHGIYRDFPTGYRALLGSRHNTGFKVLEVLRDGKPEPFHTQLQMNGIRVYLGEKNTLLDTGEHTYTLAYRTDRQVGFFNGYDELYWNVNGNGWELPLDQVSVTVTVPGVPPARLTAMNAWTGPKGSTEKDYTSGTDAAGNTFFAATRPLGLKEGLTIAVRWPKGLIQEPTAVERVKRALRDNLNSAVALAGLVLVFLYYFYAWVNVGRGPARGTVTPLYEPPDKLSPAALRYLSRMKYDTVCFSANIIDMAVKGYLLITEAEGTYIVRRTDADDTALTGDEKELAAALFKDGEQIEFKTDSRVTIKAATDALRKALEAAHLSKHFVTNTKYSLAGLCISIAFLAGATLSNASPTTFPTVFITIWLTIWTTGVAALVNQALAQWRAARYRRTAVFGALFLTLFSIPFIIGEIAGITAFIFFASLPMFLIIAAAGVVNAVFFRILKAPTRAGREILDRIEGFKIYLGEAEKSRQSLMIPPSLTPGSFEKHLPCALALGLERKWAEKFSGTLDRGGQTPLSAGPSWYHGAAWGAMGAAGFASSLGSSFSSAVSSSSSAPGSGSGGGSSGGGGGGGGGGGW